MSQSVAEKVRQIAADLFNLPVDQVTDSLSPRTLADWDSMQHLNLVLAIEARLGVQFDPSEIEQMQTVGEVIRITTRKAEK
jgi:acyl carrier protein